MRSLNVGVRLAVLLSGVSACGGPPSEPVELVSAPLEISNTTITGGSPAGAWANNGTALYAAYASLNQYVSISRRVNDNQWATSIVASKSVAGPALMEWGGMVHMLIIDTNNRLVYYRANPGSDNWTRINERVAGFNRHFRRDAALIVHAGTLKAFVPTYSWNGGSYVAEEAQELDLSGDTWVTVNYHFNVKTYSWINVVNRPNNGLMLFWDTPSGNTTSRKEFVSGLGWTTTPTQQPLLENSAAFHIANITGDPSATSLLMAVRRLTSSDTNRVVFYESHNGVDWFFKGNSEATTNARPYITARSLTHVQWLHRGTNNRLNWLGRDF